MTIWDALSMDASELDEAMSDMDSEDIEALLAEAELMKQERYGG